MKFKDYYQIMGLERTATEADIKKAYRKLAHQYHPDISKDPKGKEKFQEIGEAYAVLKNAEKRQAYDDLGKRSSGEKFTPPPDWQQHFNAGEADFNDVDLSDLFANFGAGRRTHHPRQAMPQAGQDYEITAPVSLEQLVSGAEIDVRAELPEYDQNGLAHRVTRTFRVTIPKAAMDGQRLRLVAKGGPGVNGGRAGDLYVALAFQAHPLYRLSGRDLYMDLPLTPWEAVLGKIIQLPTLEGAVELTIKPGTIAGQKLRLAKRGLLSANGDIGALYAVVQIQVPKTVSPREHELFEQLAAVSDFNPRRHFA
ncbi:DnaJ C-terminal domain-containing protein [Undibacterium sp. RTI2.1]|uniref:DnaJ C-terminal domain-containing protein n=1 Tax=unclassified Undibacterium TaxID=2630295 RepID=UPI002AB5A05D|nr:MULTISPECIES: DnaJ C-terminal domain-containing protein [unclassified Undibacterium]MDY7537422.1 DnaJ C-terminal domain-containing protein [Undibacterium sp. 5I1]MEB0033065.1 DnaJ C-terminal domain-containing protein [Undibacterium sp. RTI2.1]MEB0118426.1 DnaJ C-terminal domain-containing protein [Undibacterium sp. RTI2.2]MEB0232094.1 DnaJ C-terminal domain-containing protein [Undibacterium sp. 10I3]MEB0259383.1 DnaJ C-terminal domain-containing protein [Undibacterium sp. 5I1]